MRLKSAIACSPEWLTGLLAVDTRVKLALRGPNWRSVPFHPEAHPRLLVFDHHVASKVHVAFARCGGGLRVEPVDGWEPVYAELLQHEHELESVPVFAPLPWREVRELARVTEFSIHAVHGTVSRRWLNRYLQFFPNRSRLGATTIGGLFRVASSFGRISFSDLRPGTAPRPELDDAAAFTLHDDVVTLAKLMRRSA